MNNKERIELHCHSKFGGKATMYPGELIRYLSEMGMTAFAITDESSVVAYPELEMVWETDKYTAKPLYGMEMLVADNGDRYHISVLIKNEAGKSLLYRMITENTCEEPHPVYKLDTLLHNREGLLIGSGTDKGRLYALVLADSCDDVIKGELSKYDYVEVLPFAKYEEINKRIIALSDELDIPVVAVCDVRYTDKIGRKALQIMQHLNEETDELPDNHFWSTQEMLDAFTYLSEDKAREIVIDNTHIIAGMCEPISVYPKERYYPSVAAAEETLRCLCMETLASKYPSCKQEALERLEWELSALKSKGMESYVLQIKELLEMLHLKASDISFRGTAAGSIVTYLIGISEIDPLKHNLAPEMIYGFDKRREIDIDINIPSGRQAEVHQNVEKVKGIRKAVYGGTMHLISDPLAEAMIEKYEMDNECYFEEEIRNKLRWCISGNYLGRGKHPGGMVVFPDGCAYEDIMPIARIPGGIEITCFDYHSVDRSFVKYDLLRHDSPEMLAKLAERTGVSIESVPTDSKEVLELFKADEDGQVTGCADLPEFKTEYVRNIVALLKPDCFDDLVKVSAISHGTGSWDGTGEKLVRENGLGVKDIIADRDDVFDYNLSLGLDRETAFAVSEAVRKGIVSRGRNAKWQNWKKQLQEAGAPDWYIWSCEQIRYLFPRAHSVSYMYMTMRLGWFKVHYPDEFNAVMKEYEGIEI